MAQREATKCKSTYDHDRYLLRCFDEYLCIISCDYKNLTEEQLSGWIHTLSRHIGTIAGKIVVIKFFLEQLGSYGINNYIPLVPRFMMIISLIFFPIQS